MTKPISQTEARALRRRVELLENIIENQSHRYNASYHSGVTIFQTVNNMPELVSAIRTARACGHGVAVLVDKNNELAYQALPHPKLPI